MDVGVWLWQLASALHTLGKDDILHMDIKVENILLVHGENGVDDLLLADFGIGRAMPTGGAATSGSTIAVGQEHVAIEVDEFTGRVHQVLVERFGIRHLNTIADVERDITAIMSQYVLTRALTCVRICA